MLPGVTRKYLASDKLIIALYCISKDIGNVYLNVCVVCSELVRL